MGISSSLSKFNPPFIFNPKDYGIKPTHRPWLIYSVSFWIENKLRVLGGLMLMTIPNSMILLNSIKSCQLEGSVWLRLQLCLILHTSAFLENAALL